MLILLILTMTGISMLRVAVSAGAGIASLGVDALLLTQMIASSALVEISASNSVGI